MNKTFDYFKQLNNIPRPSGKEERVKDFLVEFAKLHNLEYSFDDTHNVIIKKPTNSNKKKALILQAHTDMVCEKNSDTTIDFDTDPIDAYEKDDFIMAHGTTLGADNGVGLSMILSILNDNSLKIPNLECVFTAQEETTMQGAIDLDFNKLKGNHLLSIDGTDEGKIEVSSAGMAVMRYSKTLETTSVDTKKEKAFKLSLTGLRGGHSGSEIHTDRQNAIKLMGQFLSTLKDLQILTLNGGNKSNAIPRECVAEIVTSEVSQQVLQDKFNKFTKEFLNIETNILGNVENLDLASSGIKVTALTKKESKNIIDFITSQQNGVLEFSSEDPTFPIVSNNFASIKLDNNLFEIIISLRSSVIKLEKLYLDKLETLANEHKLKQEIISTAPFFERKKDSYLQKLCVSTYKALYNTPALIEGVHAGLEGGVFANKNPNLDICVIAPNIYDAHSPQERVSISSIKRVYNWLERIVEEF